MNLTPRPLRRPSGIRVCWRSGILPTLVALALLVLGAAPGARGEAISLAGQWRFELDRGDHGITDRWFGRDLAGQVRLPGSLPAQGIGDPVSLATKWTGGIADGNWFKNPLYAPYTKPGDFKFPFWLQPDTYYAGAAWYQREIAVPSTWRGRRLVLHLERPHWQTRVWLDDAEIGSNDSLFTPHEYDLGTGVAPGRHRLTIRVDNRMVVDVGENSHSVSDHTQGNWNGIAGRIELRSTGNVWLKDLQVFPRPDGNSVEVRGRLDAAAAWAGRNIALRFGLEDPRTGRRGPPTTVTGEVVVIHQNRPENNVHVRVGDALPNPAADPSIQSAGDTFQVTVPLGEFTNRWDEFNPSLYRLRVELTEPGSRGPLDLRETTFGVREIATEGTQFVINGRNTFIRGTLECCIFPLTGHPPTDVESWKRVIRTAKSFGLNLLRFHSYCPPEAAFIAGDELGFYFQVETCWANGSTTIGDGKPVDGWVWTETERILAAYGNHPSFLLMLYGNEPGGRQANAYLAKYVDHFKHTDPRRLWSSGSGWPQLPENQFHVTPDPRVQSWGGGLKSRINARPPETVTDYRDYISHRTVPVISHEIGQWCVYPNFDEIPQYRGYLKPRNFEIFRDSLRARGMGDEARAFLLASGKLQTLCYKEDIESALRTPGMGGFELLDLHDFPGQGTALVGVLDPFWGEKGYVTAAEYSRFCNATVPLARLAKRVFTQDETLVAGLEVAHFGPRPLPQTAASWELKDRRGRTVAAGATPAHDIPLGNGIRLGEARINLATLPAPAQYRLVVGLAGTRFQNDWDVWLYPTQVPADPPAGVAVISELDDHALSLLRNGGRALLLVPPVAGARPQAGVALGFSSIFWNTAWTGRQPPTTLGILCDPAHPALAEFPTENHSNWQWWYLISHARPLLLDGLARDFRPTVQVIDDWVTNHKLGLLFESRVGHGKLLVCGMDLQAGARENPVARQMLRSLLDYAASPAFRPAAELTVDQIREVVAPPLSKAARDIKAVTADSAQPGYEPENAVDGDPVTLWHTPWEGTAPGFPHYLQLELTSPLELRGLTLLPRQDGNPNGTIKDFEVCVSQDGVNWERPVAQGTFPPGGAERQVLFDHPTGARFVRLVARSGHAAGPWASLAEIGILRAP